VGFSQLLFVYQKILSVVDALVFVIFNPNPKGLDGTTDAVTPLELRLNIERDAQDRAGDRLDLHLC